MKTTVAIVMSVAVVLGCAEPVVVDDKPCPCAQGFVCCSDGRCASSAERCSVPDAGPTDPTPLTMTPTSLPSPAAASFAGVWTGHLEHFQELPSDRIRIELANEGGTLTGAVIFGDTPPPPAPKRADENYPPTYTYRELYKRPNVVAGVRYTVRNVTWRDGRLRFGLVTSEAFGPWCRLQQSFAADPDAPSRTCLPNTGFSLGSVCTYRDPRTKADVVVPCARIVLCNIATTTCSCDEGGCRAADDVDLSFDLILANDTCDGSTEGRLQNNVRLTRSAK